jgi:DNA polymerase elongation subunit (family B)
MDSKMRILVGDIETAPNTAHVWGLFKQNVGINQLMDTSRTMCFAAKWVGERGPPIFYSEFHHGRQKMVETIHGLMEEADAIVTYNGERFDIPILHKEFLLDGLPPPVPSASIDLCRTVKRRFRFASNKLDHVCSELGLGNKTRHEGHELWVNCMNGDPKAWAKMMKYNKQDVLLTEKLYFKLLPWIDTHPNSGLYLNETTDFTCTNCGSDHVHSRGLQHNKSHSYIRFRCNDCGTWMRSRYSVTKKNPHILTQIGG